LLHYGQLEIKEVNIILTQLPISISAEEKPGLHTSHFYTSKEEQVSTRDT